MDWNIFDTTKNFLASVNPLVYFSMIMVFGLYVFWRGCTMTRKNNSSVFDMYFTSLFFGLVVGRVSYIINNWDEFFSFIWYWLPYEKYGNDIFLFRVLPWRFFRIWDAGIDILPMFVGFLIFASFMTLVFKKWKWSHVFVTIFFTAQGMLAMSFLMIGLVTNNQDWLVQGSMMLLLPLVLYLLSNSMRSVLMGKVEGRVLMILNTFFIILTTIYVAYVYWIIDITTIEQVSLLIFITWTFLGLILYISDSRKAQVTIEKVSSVREISKIDVNQPIKLP